jgi:hypothetical protein
MVSATVALVASEEGGGGQCLWLNSLSM